MSYSSKSLFLLGARGMCVYMCVCMCARAWVCGHGMREVSKTTLQNKGGCESNLVGVQDLLLKITLRGVRFQVRCNIKPKKMVLQK